MAPNPRRFAPIAALASAALAIALPARATDVRVHGLFDVVAAERGRAFDANVLTRGDSPFDAFSLRLFVDGKVNDRVQIFSQIVMRDASETALYVDGAYVSWTPRPGHDLHVLAGKVPWLLGTWAPRTYSNVNPLIGQPLMYQYHSSLLWYAVPPDADALLGAAGTGQYGVNYFGFEMGRGMPLVDDSYWDVGATLAGSVRPLEYAVGMVAGTPGWGSTAQDENSGKSVLARLGFAPLPALRVGVSGAYGPYLNDSENPDLPAGRSATDYHQILAMADLELLLGHFELRMEGADNTWESPFIGDLGARSGYAELKYAFGFGGFVAGRYDALRFSEITDSGGNSRPWDHDVTRVETGVGYRFDRAAVAKLVFQQTRYDREGLTPSSPRYSLIAGQLSFKF